MLTCLFLTTLAALPDGDDPQINETGLMQVTLGWQS